MFLVLLSLAFAAAAVLMLLPKEITEAFLSRRKLAIVTLGLGFVWTPIAAFLINYVGDAARYLHVRPPNIDVRRRIRTAGVDLLNKLHGAGEESKYSRIVIVGHSLGSVIGYDILTYFWQSCHSKLAPKGKQPVDALEVLEAMAQLGDVNPNPYQQAQPAYFSELSGQGCPWLVTDFITLGSPLAHAELLLAKEMKELRDKQKKRELPTCPPALELENPVPGKPEPIEERFSFVAKGDIVRKPHHAALFGPTRWTNLYFPSRLVLFGDPIGGEVARVFGDGVKDVPVATNQRLGIFTHTLYWDPPKGKKTAPHIDALRAALRIAKDPPAVPCGQALAAPV